MHAEMGNRRECPQVRLLALSLLGIGWPRLHPCGKEADAVDLILWQKSLTERIRISQRYGVPFRQP